MVMKFVYPFVVSRDLVSLCDYLVTRILRRSRVCTDPEGVPNTAPSHTYSPLREIAPSSSTGRSMPASQHATIGFHSLLGERRHIPIVCQLLLRVSPESNIPTFPTSSRMKYKPRSTRSLYSSLPTPPWPHRRCPPKWATHPRHLNCTRSYDTPVSCAVLTVPG